MHFGELFIHVVVLSIRILTNQIIRRRPYLVECAGSLLTSEVKQRRARSVPGWVAAWEDLRVLSAFLPAFLRGKHGVIVSFLDH